MKDKTSIIVVYVAVLALLISAGHFIYYVWLSEEGPISAKPEYYVAVSDSIRIENEFNGLTLSPFIEIYNTGNKAGNISRISAVLSLRNVFKKKDLVASSYVFPENNIRLDPAPFSIQPAKTWSARVYFCLPPREQDVKDKTELDFRVANYLQTQYHHLKNNNIPYFISGDLHKEVEKIMKRNIEWIEEGEYTFTIMLWDDPRSKKHKWKKDYKFRLSKEVIKGINEYQITSYKTPPKYPNNLYMKFVITPSLSEIQ